VDTRGVDKLGKGTGPAAFDINVIVEGVRVVSEGEGGKTNSVCEGVETMEATSEALWDAFRRTLLRRCNGGGTTLCDSFRCRTGGNVKLVVTARGRIVVCGGSSVSRTRVTGEEGTVGRILRLMGRGFFFGLGRDGS